MRRMLSCLQRGVLGMAVVGSLGFGAMQAFASQVTAEAAARACPAKMYEYWTADCANWCRQYGYTTGYCATNGYCACGLIP